jgi:hypothetical protein
MLKRGACIGDRSNREFQLLPHIVDQVRGPREYGAHKIAISFFRFTKRS